MADRFYTPDALSPGEYILAGAESHHLSSVCRLGPGDRVTLFNGDGLDYPADVVSADRKRTVLTVHPGVRVGRELPFRVELAVAMPKGDRGEFLVEKLTELGVRRFTPLRTARTVVHPKDSRLDKLQHGVVEASKQCGRNVLMEIRPPVPWAILVADEDLPGVRVILHPTGTGTVRRLAELPVDQVRAHGVVFAVGPEGGFAEEEVLAAEERGWVRAALGPRILRIETAAIVVAAWAADQ